MSDGELLIEAADTLSFEGESNLSKAVYKAAARIRELESELDYTRREYEIRLDTARDRILEQRELLGECEKALTPFGVFADELVYDDDPEQDDDAPNELWSVSDGELKAVKNVLKKLREKVGHTNA